MEINVPVDHVTPHAQSPSAHNVLSFPLFSSICLLRLEEQTETLSTGWVNQIKQF